MVSFGTYDNLKVKNWHFSLPPSDLMPSLGVIVSEFPDEPSSPKTRIIGLSDGEDLVILASFI